MRKSRWLNKLKRFDENNEIKDMVMINHFDNLSNIGIQFQH